MHLHPLILSPYRFQSVSLSGDLSNKGLPLSPYSVPLFPPARHPGCLPSCLAWDSFSRLSLASFSLAPLSPLPSPLPSPQTSFSSLSRTSRHRSPYPAAPSSPLPWHRETAPAGTGRRLTPGQPDAGQQQAERRRGRAQARGPHGARGSCEAGAHGRPAESLACKGRVTLRSAPRLALWPRASAPPPRRLAPPRAGATGCPAARLRLWLPLPRGGRIQISGLQVPRGSKEVASAPRSIPYSSKIPILETWVSEGPSVGHPRCLWKSGLPLSFHRGPGACHSVGSCQWQNQSSSPQNPGLCSHHSLLQLPGAPSPYSTSSFEHL